ncbi:50S ribosomal protein L11 [Candidatus Berkelbacteria bacterium]|nr:50S ribosomal protein L11 [Candidatus Berkelbacteria bacterium]
MAKKIKTTVKLQVPGGQATPAPPVGTALGPQGINIGEFVSKFNEQTKDQPGIVLPVLLTIFEDRTFTFIIKTPPASFLLKKAAGLEKGSGTPKREKVGKVSRTQVADIAKTKLPDLNTADLGQAVKIIEGTARSMGIEVTK